MKFRILQSKLGTAKRCLMGGESVCIGTCFEEFEKIPGLAKTGTLSGRISLKGSKQLYNFPAQQPHVLNGKKIRGRGGRQECNKLQHKFFMLNNCHQRRGAPSTAVVLGESRGYAFRVNNVLHSVVVVFVLYSIFARACMGVFKCVFNYRFLQKRCFLSTLKRRSLHNFCLTFFQRLFSNSLYALLEFWFLSYCTTFNKLLSSALFSLFVFVTKMQSFFKSSFAIRGLNCVTLIKHTTNFWRDRNNKTNKARQSRQHARTSFGFKNRRLTNCPSERGTTATQQLQNPQQPPHNQSNPKAPSHRIRWSMRAYAFGSWKGWLNDLTWAPTCRWRLSKIKIDGPRGLKGPWGCGHDIEFGFWF